MTTGLDRVGPAGDEPTRPATLVWIDAREAVIVHCHDDLPRIVRLESDVPAHHRSTGHVRHDPAVRHGGGGPSQTAGEPNRLDHLRRFVHVVADRLDPDDDLLVIGPGTVHLRLERHVRESDAHEGHHRAVSCEASPPLTDRQLVARVRRFSGTDPRRATIGTYRWSDVRSHRGSGRVEVLPRRVDDKPPRRRGSTGPNEGR